MINFERLEKERKRKGITNEDISNALDIDLSTWYRKKKAPSSITIGDIDTLKILFSFSDEEAKEIFLS